MGSERERERERERGTDREMDLPSIPPNPDTKTGREDAANVLNVYESNSYL